MAASWERSLGAVYLGNDRCRFRVWAPAADRIALHLLTPADRTVTLEPEPFGYHCVVVDGVPPGSRYLYRLGPDGPERPDPASQHQPDGVHGPSAVVDPAFPWEDADWFGRPLCDYVLYELHVGTFTSEGTFDAVIPHLDGLRDLGVTAIELMPVAQFPGSRNWGYDGVYPFAVQDSYGGPAGLKRLVNACHRRNLALVLDVVYNHLGPEGNYLRNFGPYFTPRYQTPWGEAVNLDGPHSDDVRRYFVENACQWVGEFHADGLRLDAVHALTDQSPRHFLAELAASVKRVAAGPPPRRVHLIAESDLNDPRVVRPPEQGGYGLDGQWNDDFHHALHVLLTGETAGYYANYGGLAPLARTYTDGFAYTGQYAPYHRRRHGAPAGDVPPGRLVVFAQNHDQVGNRFRGDRLAATLDFEGQKLAAGAVLLSPFLPLMFMGEEYGEPAPFRYFVSHSDPGLVEAVRKGRAEEFAHFAGAGEAPDPQSEAEFRASRPDRGLREHGRHRTLYEFHRALLRLRRTVPALAELSRDGLEVHAFEDPRVLAVLRRCGDSAALALYHFGSEPAAVTLPLPAGAWRKRLDSADATWAGPGGALPERLGSPGEVTLRPAPRSVALYVRE